MQKDWFPFFSMLFWCFTKIFGLSLAVGGLWGIAGSFTGGFSFFPLLFTGLMPVAVGGIMLTTEIVFDLATAEQRNRQTLAK